MPSDAVSLWKLVLFVDELEINVDQPEDFKSLQHIEMIPLQMFFMPHSGDMTGSFSPQWNHGASGYA